MESAVAPRPIEIVIDGTNFGGKTPLVERLTAELEQRGYRVYRAAPYREGEVYPLWDSHPELAAATIIDRMERHRRLAGAAEVLIWDRGWPTCYISTQHPVARQRFAPLPSLSFLLLNSAETTARKVQKYGITSATHPWMHRHRLRDEISYEQLAEELPDRLRSYTPTLEDSRFDLPLVANDIVLWVERERAAQIPQPHSLEKKE